MKRIFTYLFLGAILFGLVLRIISLFYNGIFDMETYYEWGLAALTNGLHESYHGTYFPIQYQIFEFGTWLAFKLNVEHFIVFKSMNLIFDCGNLFVLYLIFKKMGVSYYYLLIYWLHPWFLNMFSLGYIDFQFSFFILLSLYFTLRGSKKNYLISGLFLGVAFLMKPQVQIIIIAFFIYCALRYRKDKDFKPFYIFAFPLALFILYSLFFFIATGSPLRLVNTYVNVSKVMPCLNANFLNAWFSTAYLLKGIDSPIYSVSDQLSIFHIQLKFFAVIAVFVLITYFLKNLINNTSKGSDQYNFLLIACISSIVLPFVMTSAHENHLFLGSILMIPILAKSKSNIIKVSIHLILILQFINLYGYYQIGEITTIKSISIKMVDIYYTYEKAFVLSLLAFSAFIILMVYFLNPKSGFLKQFKNPEGTREIGTN
jgi:hypothetical protein